MTPRYARARRGRRAIGAVPNGHGDRLTVLGALGLNGFEAAMTVKSGTTHEVFEADLCDVLLPHLIRTRDPGAMVLLDQLSAHKGDLVRRLVTAAGFVYRLLPRYSPDLSPIEPAWSKLKTALRAREARTLEALDQALPSLLDTLSADNAKGWFRHCGYLPSH